MIDAKLPENFPQWMKDHVDKYMSSKGTDGHMMKIRDLPEVPTLLLVTRGRKSGGKFLFPLIYGKHGNSYVVIASKGGAPEHPGWYKNLAKDPNVELQVGTEHLKAKARTASGAERARLWDQLVASFAPFADYQVKAKAANREIPVVILDPVK